MKAIIGQYSDFLNISYAVRCGCGRIAEHSFGSFAEDTRMDLCDGCFFRYTVMKAAGREKEFLNAALPS
jgi:hypothetical protein